jgi:hypothetical protein
MSDAVEEEAQKMHGYLKGRGFEAGESVIRFVPEFDVAQLRDAHYGSTYNEPKPLRIELAKDLVLQVVVEMSRAVYGSVTSEFQTQNPFGCYRFPDWYVEGWLLKSGFDPYDEVVHVRLYLGAGMPGFQEGYIQRIPEEPDVEGRINYIDGI